MNKPADLPVDFNDEDSNTSRNPRFEDVLAARLSRRGMLRTSLSAALTTAFGATALTACGGGDGAAAPATAPAPAPEELLGFAAVAKTLADQATVPEGYTATTVFATGDPMFADVGSYKNDGTDTRFDRRSGDCHDGMEYFGLSGVGTPDPLNSDRALIGINFEYITPQYLHASGPSPRPRPPGETDIEVDAHGVGIVEFRKQASGQFTYEPTSAFNRRVTPLTEIQISGPARGHPLLVTKFSTDATKTRGTLNNCGTGKTPWGTLMTGEENWAGYFRRAGADNAARSANENVALARYGRNVTGTSDANSRYGWESSGAEDKYQRWDITVTGTTAAEDYRNEINGQGYVTEIDPYDPSSVIKKRTALGRMAHESAAFSIPAVGKPLAVYLGDDSRGEYVYKFVTSAAWQASDATPADRIATGDKYLDSGKLYVARFDGDGTGQWIELSMANPIVAGNTTYAFADEGDVAMHSRIAADAVGATRMDRPEWCGVHPTTGEIYFTMTNNSNRRVAPTGSQLAVDAANPRAYSDIKGASTTQQGNVNGHILRLKESGDEPAATSFQWDVYLFGAESAASPTLVNLSGLTDDQDFSSPDGLVFSPTTGICWIQTDDGAYTDTTNCMMLAALPGELGDGGPVTLNYGSTTVTSRMGKKATPATLKRFFVGPVGNEITGFCETPDAKVVFINVQHPAGHWPGNEGYGAGGSTARPRSATVMITKDDGGRVGS